MLTNSQSPAWKFSQNVISKSSPLIITIKSAGNNILEVKNNIQPKIITDAMDFEAGLDNLAKKYELLNKAVTVSDGSGKYRVIELSLITKKEEAII